MHSNSLTKFLWMCRQGKTDKDSIVDLLLDFLGSPDEKFLKGERSQARSNPDQLKRNLLRNHIPGKSHQAQAKSRQRLLLSMMMTTMNKKRMPLKKQMSCLRKSSSRSGSTLTLNVSIWKNATSNMLWKLPGISSG